MRTTPKQFYVLEHLDRVRARPYKAAPAAPLPKYQLDGWDCTDQIRALLVQDRIKRDASGTIARAEPITGTLSRSGSVRGACSGVT